MPGSLKKRCCRHPVCLVQCGRWHKFSQNRNRISNLVWEHGQQHCCTPCQTSIQEGREEKYRIGAVAPNKRCCAFFSSWPKYSIDKRAKWCQAEQPPRPACHSFALLCRLSWTCLSRDSHWFNNKSAESWKGVCFVLSLHGGRIKECGNKQKWLIIILCLNISNRLINLLWWLTRSWSPIGQRPEE